MGEVSGGGTVEVPGVGAGAGTDVELAHARLRDASCIIVGQPLLDQWKAEEGFIKAVEKAKGGTIRDIPIIVIPSEESQGSWSQRKLPDVFSQVYKVVPDESRWGPDGMIGDVLGWAIAIQRKLTQPSHPTVEFTEKDPTGLEPRLTAPVCFGGLGSPEVQNGLRIGAGFAGLPFLSISRDGGEPFVDTPPAAPLSAVLEAYRLSLSHLAGEPQDAFARSRELGGWTLLRCVDGHVRPSHLLTGLLFDQDNDIFARPDYHSMCADLLDRRGWHGEALALRRLIKYWRSQNIWSANLVPEMVLHDAAHSQSVDRIMACLCEPLLASTAIDEADLVILACAAWLHDWGCNASAEVGRVLLTDPRDIRAFHGYLSQIRLVEDSDKHRLDDELGFNYEGSKHYQQIKEFGDIAVQVGLISAHHVGATSSGTRRVSEENKKTIKQWGSESRVDYPTVPTKPSSTDKILVQPFDDDFKFSCPSDLDPERMEPGLQKAHRRLALLRIADAIDAGWHRIPNYETQASNCSDIADAFFASYDQVAHMLDEMIGAVDKGFKWSEEKISPLEGVKESFGKKLERDKAKASYPVWARDSEATSFTVKEPTQFNTEAFDIIKQFYFRMVRDVANYADHLLDQEDYYAEQRQFRAVFPTLEQTNDSRFELKLDALAGLPGDQVWTEDKLQNAKDDLRALFFRELGQKTNRRGKKKKQSGDADKEPGDADKEPGDADKEPIAWYLNELGIKVPREDEQETMSLRIETSPGSTRSAPTGVAATVIEPLTAVPNGWGGWLCMDHDQPSVIPTGPPPRHSRPLASCLDKRVIVGVSGEQLISNDDCLNDASLCGHDDGSDFQALALNHARNTMVVQALTHGGWSLREYHRDGADGSFVYAQEFNTDRTKQVVRALYLPHKDHEDLFMLLGNGRIDALGSGHSICAVIGEELNQVSGIDAVRQGEDSVWIAYITGGKVTVKTYHPRISRSPELEQPAPNYHPSDVWFTQVDDDRPVLVIEYLNNNVGDGRRRFRWRSFRVPTGL